QFNLRAASGPYQAPSVGGVERAYLAAQAAFRSGGVSELAHQGLLCFRGLERKPSYELMDYCIAFDEFGAGLTARVAQGEQPSPASWFGSAGARHLNTAKAVMSGQGDADARLLDLRRMVAQRSGDMSRAALPPPLAR